jgi:thiamine pyrophosphokinase
MEQGICHVVGAGDFQCSLIQKKEGDLIIAADGGYALLKEGGMVPDLFLGDGDSLGFCPKDLPAILLPSVKDDTDTLAALKEGLRRGYRRFALYGALGGNRFSHSLANLQALLFLKEQGAQGEIIDPRCRISLWKEGSYRFAFSGGYFSLFAWGEEACLSLTGAKYPLDHAILSPSFPLGVSNEGTAEVTTLSLHRGTVLLVREP